MNYEDVKKKAIEEYPDLEKLPTTKAIIYAYRYRKEMQRYHITDFNTLMADACFVENYGKHIRLGENLISSPPPVDLPNIKPYQHNKCIKCRESKNDCIPICFECFERTKAIELKFYEKRE
jgi:hypothetical protein